MTERAQLIKQARDWLSNGQHGVEEALRLVLDVLHHDGSDGPLMFGAGRIIPDGQVAAFVRGGGDAMTRFWRAVHDWSEYEDRSPLVTWSQERDKGSGVFLIHVTKANMRTVRACTLAAGVAWEGPL